jgi:hypothetical protein
VDHDDDAPRSVPGGWLEARAESDADLAAGRIVPAGVVRTEMHASIARIEAQLAREGRPDHPEAEPQRRAVPNRP